MKNEDLKYMCIRANGLGKLYSATIYLILAAHNTWLDGNGKEFMIVDSANN